MHTSKEQQEIRTYSLNRIIKTLDKKNKLVDLELIANQLEVLQDELEKARDPMVQLLVLDRYRKARCAQRYSTLPGG